MFDDRSCHGILGLANNPLPVVVNGGRLSCVSRLPVPRRRHQMSFVTSSNVVRDVTADIFDQITGFRLVFREFFLFSDAARLVIEKDVTGRRKAETREEWVTLGIATE